MEYIKNLALLLLTIIILLITGEGILSTGYFDGLDNPKAIWIPEKYKKLDREINLRNFEFSAKNKLWFNDKDRTQQKPLGIEYRVAVLGDSSIFGDGVAYDVIWSHKLEKSITKNYPKIEVLSWGRNGWSTKQQYEFLKKGAPILI